MSLKDTLAALFKGKSGNLAVQVFRYLVSGGTAFVVDAGLLALLTELFGREYLLIWTAIAFAAGTFFPNAIRLTLVVAPTVSAHVVNAVPMFPWSIT